MKNDEFSELRKALQDQSEVVEDCCGNCVWLQYKDGTCHRMPPSMIRMQDSIEEYTLRNDGIVQPYRTVAVINKGLWPEVDKDDWCGEFESGDQD